MRILHFITLKFCLQKMAVPASPLSPLSRPYIHRCRTWSSTININHHKLLLTSLMTISLTLAMSMNRLLTTFPCNVSLSIYRPIPLMIINFSRTTLLPTILYIVMASRVKRNINWSWSKASRPFTSCFLGN